MERWWKTAPLRHIGSLKECEKEITVEAYIDDNKYNTFKKNMQYLGTNFVFTRNIHFCKFVISELFITWHIDTH